MPVPTPTMSAGHASRAPIIARKRSTPEFRRHGIGDAQAVPLRAACARWRCGGTVARGIEQAHALRLRARRWRDRRPRRSAARRCPPARTRARRPARPSAPQRRALQSRVAEIEQPVLRHASQLRPDADFAGVDHTRRAAVEAHAQRAVGREAFAHGVPEAVVQVQHDGATGQRIQRGVSREEGVEALAIELARARATGARARRRRWRCVIGFRRAWRRSIQGWSMCAPSTRACAR